MRNHNRSTGLTLGLMALILGGLAQARPAPRAVWKGRVISGPEFELTNHEILKRSGDTAAGLEDAAHRFAAQVRSSYPKLKVVDVPRGKWGKEHQVQFPDGFWLRISYDPGCVEILARPQSRSEWAAHRKTIDGVVFKTGEKLGLYADGLTGAGHFNFDVTNAFKGDARHFAAFAADFANHPELALGVLGNDFKNAPPLAMLSDKARGELTRIVEETRAGKHATPRAVALQIQRRVYFKAWDTSDPQPHHNQALSMEGIAEAKSPAKERLEIRSVFAQQSVEDFTLLHDLISDRLRWLKTHRDQIDYAAVPTRGFDEKELVSRFYSYVMEMGGSWKKYRRLLGGEMSRLSPNKLVRGEVDWQSGAYRKLALTYAREAASSSWIRARLREAMADPTARQFPEYAQIQATLQSLSSPSAPR